MKTQAPTKQKKVFNKYYRYIMEVSPDAIVFLDLKGKVIKANKKAAHLHGYNNPREIIGRDTSELIIAEEKTKLIEQIKIALAEGFVSNCEFHLIHKDGHIIPVEVNAALIKKNKKPEGFIVLTRDITFRKQMEKTYQVLVDNSLLGFALFQNEKAVFFNQEFLDVFGGNGKKTDDLTLTNLIGMIHPKDREKFNKNIPPKISDDSKSSRSEIRMVNSQEKISWLDMVFFSVDFNNSPALQISFVDITYKKEREESLLSSNLHLEKTIAERTSVLIEYQKALQKLTHKIVKSQEEERRIISRELHDETGQALIRLKYCLNSTKAIINPNFPPQMVQKINECSEIINSLISQTRSLSHKLRPPSLDPGGVNVALSEYCLEFATSSGLEIIYQGQNLEGIQDEISINIFRLLQEALRNIAKHARAKKVNISFGLKNGLITLSIKDDGKGYDPGSPTNGIGILGMKERIIQFRGKLEIESKPGKGTRLTALIPFGEI
jgi:PAS domain S-box-containing protein